jgi:hypothetical protein
MANLPLSTHEDGELTKLCSVAGTILSKRSRVFFAS